MENHEEFVMPIGYIRQTHGTRSNGQSAVASSAYRSGEILEDKRYGKTHDYSRKENILYTDFMYPDGSPEWVTKGRGSFWNAVEAFEDRKDARLYRDFMGALQNDMTAEDNIKIVKLFSEHLRAQGMVVDVAVHGSSPFNKENMHVHILGSERNVGAEGFGLKSVGSLSRSWNTKEWYNEQRRKYLEITNSLRLERGLSLVEYNDKKGESIHYLPSVWREMQKANKTLGLVYEEIATYTEQMEKLDMEIQQAIIKPKEIAPSIEDTQTSKGSPSATPELTKKDWINKYLNESPETWNAIVDRMEKGLILLREEVVLNYVKNYAGEIKKEIDEIELPRLKKLYKDFLAQEPAVEKRGLFNKEAVESQIAYHKEWEEKAQRIQRAGVAKMEERDKIEDIKSDSDFINWKKERIKTDQAFYERTLSIYENPVQCLTGEYRIRLEAYKEAKRKRASIQRNIEQETNITKGSGGKSMAD